MPKDNWKAEQGKSSHILPHNCVERRLKNQIEHKSLWEEHISYLSGFKYIADNTFSYLDIKGTLHILETELYTVLGKKLLSLFKMCLSIYSAL